MPHQVLTVLAVVSFVALTGLFAWSAISNLEDRNIPKHGDR